MSYVILGQKVSKPMLSFLTLATVGVATYASRGGSKQKKQEHTQQSFGASSKEEEELYANIRAFMAEAEKADKAKH